MATDNDIVRWKDRTAILSSLIELKGKFFIKIKEQKVCQWLINNECSINDIKPDRCKSWPKRLNQINEINCKGLKH
jgi:Fe-S-cluster containining protein